MAKKTQNENVDLDYELNEVAIKADVKTVGGGGKILPVELVNALKTKFDNDGSFAVPKVWLEEKIGFDTEKPMKGRPNAIKKKLNRQFGDIIDDDKIWHIGNSGNTHYLISILAVTSDEVDKWKKPKPKKEEEPEVED